MTREEELKQRMLRKNKGDLVKYFTKIGEKSGWGKKIILGSPVFNDIIRQAELKGIQEQKNNEIKWLNTLNKNAEFIDKNIKRHYYLGQLIQERIIQLKQKIKRK